MSDHSVESLVVLVIVSVLGCASAWVISVIAVNIRKSRVSQRIADIHGKLLDRFGNSGELMAYLEGDAGKRFFESLTLDVRDSMSRVLESIQAGVVLLLLGIALLSLRAGPYAPWIRQILLLSGVATAAIGVGLLISAWITMRLCQKWGLLKNGRDLS